MKKFLIKSSIVFLFCLLLFRFTVIALINDYEQKITELSSSSNRLELKQDIINSIKKANEKDKILYNEDAEVISIFIKKILSELDLK